MKRPALKTYEFSPFLFGKKDVHDEFPPSAISKKDVHDEFPPFVFSKKDVHDEFPPGLEPGTFSVLERCDNHYTMETGYLSPLSYST